MANTHFGCPLAASSAASEPAEETKYTVPSAIAGDEAMGMLDLNFHFSVPVAWSTAYR